MIISDSSMKVGGNALLHWIGTRLQKMGSNIINKYKVQVVTNPSCKLLNPFTLVVNFTADASKYQIVIQGDYKKIYKEIEDSKPEISEKELFMIIYHSRGDWFKKE